MRLSLPALLLLGALPRCALGASMDAMPAGWAADAARGSLLYAASDAGLPPSQLPAVGNGYLATQIGGDALFVAGVFNGHATDAPSHRARIPSPVNVRAPGTPAHAALHLREATYYRRSWLPPWKDAGVGFAPCGPWWADTLADSCTSTAAPRAWFEQRWVAHRALRNVLVMEVEALGDEGPAMDAAERARHGGGEVGDDGEDAAAWQGRFTRPPRGAGARAATGEEEDEVPPGLYRKAYATPEELVRSGEELNAGRGAAAPRPYAMLRLDTAAGAGAPR